MKVEIEWTRRLVCVVEVDSVEAAREAAVAVAQYGCNDGTTIDDWEPGDWELARVDLDETDAQPCMGLLDWEFLAWSDYEKARGK